MNSKPITGKTDWTCDLPQKNYSIERVMRPQFRLSFGGCTSYYKTRLSAIKALAWSIYWHENQYEKEPGYFCAGEFIVSPSYVSCEPEGTTKADRRRRVNGIAMYQLGYNKLLYPPNLVCGGCGTPYYYDECSTETIWKCDFHNGPEYNAGVTHYPEKEKCKHACDCDEYLYDLKGNIA